LLKDENLGRLKITTVNGDIDGDGDFDQIYFGRRTFELNPSLFNNDEGEADGRSDDKGAEPEAVATLEIGDSILLFIGLERTGGAMVYDISNPSTPVFIDWLIDASDVGSLRFLLLESKA